MASAPPLASCSYCGGAIQITQRRERLTLYRCTQCSMKGATYDSDDHGEDRIDEALDRPPEEILSDRRTERGS